MEQIDEDGALAAMASVAHDLPPGFSLRVAPLGSTVLWSGSCIDESGLPNPGSATLIGPDARVWTLSSNPGIHDFDLAVRLLDRAYQAGFGRFLDPRAFELRVAQLTGRHLQEEREFLGDLKAGALRGSPAPSS